MPLSWCWSNLKICSRAASPRVGSAMAFDAVIGRVCLIGVKNDGFRPPNGLPHWNTSHPSRQSRLAPRTLFTVDVYFGRRGRRGRRRSLSMHFRIVGPFFLVCEWQLTPRDLLWCKKGLNSHVAGLGSPRQDWLIHLGAGSVGDPYWRSRSAWCSTGTAGCWLCTLMCLCSSTQHFALVAPAEST